MIARWSSSRPCAGCGQPILEGQEITGYSTGDAKRQWMHTECTPEGASAPTPAPSPAPSPAPASNGNGRQLRTPGAPMNEKQRRFIETLLTERQFTMGEASTLIDFLKAKPKKTAAPANDLARVLG